jgi:hypothetical protein
MLGINPLWSCACTTGVRSPSSWWDYMNAESVSWHWWNDTSTQRCILQYRCFLTHWMSACIVTFLARHQWHVVFNICFQSICSICPWSTSVHMFWYTHQHIRCIDTSSVSTRPPLTRLLVIQVLCDAPVSACVWASHLHRCIFPLVMFLSMRWHFPVHWHVLHNDTSYATTRPIPRHVSHHVSTHHLSASSMQNPHQQTLVSWCSSTYLQHCDESAYHCILGHCCVLRFHS